MGTANVRTHRHPYRRPYPTPGPRSGSITVTSRAARNAGAETQNCGGITAAGGTYRTRFRALLAQRSAQSPITRDTAGMSDATSWLNAVRFCVVAAGTSMPIACASLLSMKLLIKALTRSARSSPPTNADSAASHAAASRARSAHSVSGGIRKKRICSEDRSAEDT